MEASGSKAWWRRWRRRGLPVVVVNARQVRDFARALGILAKTDRIDARVIAQFAQAVRPEVRVLKSEDLQELKALVARRRQLLEMLTAERHWLGQHSDPGQPARTRNVEPPWHQCFGRRLSV